MKAAFMLLSTSAIRTDALMHGWGAFAQWYSEPAMRQARAQAQSARPAMISLSAPRNLEQPEIRA
jgi:hypothetical protein